MKSAQALRAEGYAAALEAIFNTAKTVDSNTMMLQYLDALKAIGASPSTKYIFPMEFTSLIRPLIAGQNGDKNQGQQGLVARHEHERPRVR